MSPSEIDEILLLEPFPQFRLSLASGDQIVVRDEGEPFVSGLSLILQGDRSATRITTFSRLVSIPNIAYLELLNPNSAPPSKSRRRR